MSITLNGWSNVCKHGLLLDEYKRLGNLRTFTGPNFGPCDDYFFNLSCEEDYLRAYNECPPLKAIIGKRAKAFNNGKIELLDDDGDYATGSYADRITRALKNPNPLQTQKQYFSQQNHYIDIFGYCPVLVIRPSGMPDEITSIWNIPPWLFDLDYTGKWLNQKDVAEIYKRFYILWNGQKIELDYDAVTLIFDDGIGTDCDTNLTIPDSRLKAEEYPVSNIIAAFKSRNTLITKRGAIGILSNDKGDAAGFIPLTDKEKNQVHADFSRYGIVGQPFQVIITDAALKWQQMGFPTKDLLLFEEVEADINALCDAYDWPVELMARDKGVTFANKNEAKKYAYENAIVPESEARMEQFQNAIIDPDSGITLHADFSHLPILQEDDKHKAEARRALNEALRIEYDAGLITRNDWREALGHDRIGTQEFNLYKTMSNETATSEDPAAEA